MPRRRWLGRTPPHMLTLCASRVAGPHGQPHERDQLVAVPHETGVRPRGAPTPTSTRRRGPRARRSRRARRRPRWPRAAPPTRDRPHGAAAPTAARPCRRSSHYESGSPHVDRVPRRSAPSVGCAPVTLAATVREAAARFGPRAAFVDPDGSRLSYADLDRRSDEVAAGLRADGRRARRRRAAPPAVRLDLRGRLRRRRQGRRHHRRGEPAARAARAGGGQPRPPAARSSSTPRIRWRRCGGPSRVAPLDDDPERPVALVFTSGTTGEPKGALFREPPAGRRHAHRRRPTRGAIPPPSPRRCSPAPSSPTSASPPSCPGTCGSG